MENNLPTNFDFASRRIWIDLSLALAGAVCAWQGFYPVAVGLVLVALVAPVLRLRQRRRGDSLLALVPDELADAYRSLVEATALPGVTDRAEALTAADDAVLEAAVLLVGREPRGATQRRFVEARVAAMNDTAALLRERHHAVTEAMKELDEIGHVDTTPTAPVPTRTSNGFVVRAFALALMPLFLLFDTAVGVVKLGRVLLEGVALRLRATGRIGLVALRHSWTVMSEARLLWRSARSTMAAAWRDSRRTTTALRLRVRLQVRHLRRRALS